jgi:hypothetical protein
LKVSLARRIAHMHTRDRAVTVGAERDCFRLIVDLRVRQAIDDAGQRVYEGHTAGHRHAQAPSGVAVGKRLLEVDPGHGMAVEKVERRGHLAGECAAIVEVGLAF